MKKTIYYIEFENHENLMCKKIRISEKEFEKQLKFLKQQTEISKYHEDETKIEEDEGITFVYEKVTVTKTKFRCRMAYTILYKYEYK